jgi:hypothetical protein
MNSKHWALCIGVLGVGALALLAGLPPFYLLLLVCPLMMMGMMMVMMPGMHGGQDKQQDNASKPDGSHERIDQH